MRLLLSWARDFVAIDASPEVVAETLALRGFEVAGIEPAPEGVHAPWSTESGPDAVIDFEVTANRPDCLSVLGLAREIATAFGRPLSGLPVLAPGSRPRATVSSPSTSDASLEVDLEDAAGCPRYTAAVAEVTNGDTPSWMAARLVAAGLRPISPFVDLTNYVLMEIGHPMHAFDLTRLAGRRLRIRRARPDESLKTLDNVDRRLDPTMLVIADAERAQAVGGVMGGNASEVSAGTRLVAFESACFEPTTIRRTSKRLGLKTEASARFERGADIAAPPVALERALGLMEAIGIGRRIGHSIDRYPSPRQPAGIALRRARIERLLGLSVPDAEVERILAALGMTLRASPDGWMVTIPTFRVDLTREVDLIEEVGRHHGFDRLEPSFPAVVAPALAPDPRVERDRAVRAVATAAGLSEAVTFGFIEHDAAAPFAQGAEADAPARLVRIGNPLSAKFEVLRPSLLPGLIDALAHNRRHGQRDVRLFELGARFTPEGEARAFAAVWTGAVAPEHWSRSGRDADLFDASGLVERLCAALHVAAHIEPTTAPPLVAGQAAAVMVGGRAVGVLGRLQPALAEARGVPRQDRVFVAEIDLDPVSTAARPRGAVRPLPRFPAVVRDLSVVVSERLSAAIIRGTIQAAAAGGPAPLVAIEFFDRYIGKGVADGCVSLSVHVTFRSDERTLTDSEVQDSVDRIVGELVRQHQAVQR